MAKLLKLVCLSLLAFTVVGCGKKVIVPEKTIAAVYIDVEKLYDNGKGVANTIIDALPADAKAEAKRGYEEALKEIDKVKDAVKAEWAIVTFGGDLKSLAESKEPVENIAAVIKVKASEDDITKSLKDFGDDVKTEKKDGNVVFDFGKNDPRHCGLIDEKYLVISMSKDAFEDMFDLYAGKGKSSDDFGDLSEISGNTVCRISTAPISSLLKRFELTKEVEKFGEACDDKDLAEMILNMGAISLDVGVGDKVALAVSAAFGSSDDATIIENLMGSAAFFARVGCDGCAYACKYPELFEAAKLPRDAKSAIASLGGLYTHLAKTIKATRDGNTAKLSIALEVKEVVNLIEKMSSSFSSYSKESKTAACISNMKQLQVAAEQHLVVKDSTPTLKDLCGPDKYLRTEPTCPKDGSHYRISRGYGGIEIKCGSGDPEHVLPE